MPELPEVQTVVNELCDAGVVGQTVHGVDVLWHRTVAPHKLDAFINLLMERTIVALDRRAKYLRFALDDGQTLYGHLRMSGRLRLDPTGTRPRTHDRLRMELSGGQTLCFEDTRKFGRWQIVEDRQVIEAKLGIEPLEDDFTVERLCELLLKSRRAIKPHLLDQSQIAGLGNIYVDEALWHAKIHPTTPANAVSKPKTQLLHEAIPLVLHRGLANLGTSLGTGKANFYSVAQRQGRNADALNVFRRTGQPCPRCGASIVFSRVAQRGTHTCPRCQRPPRR